MTRCTILLLLAQAAAPALATVIHVPADRPTIQSALDAAQAGDTVRVAAGTYGERLDFLGKALRLEAAAALPLVRLVGDGLPGSLVTMTAPVQGDAELVGFSIEGGDAGGPAGLGGGLRVEGGAPLILGNRFVGNRAVFGGAVGLWNSEARLLGNGFEGNDAAMGGAVHAEGGAPVLERNAFVSNRAADPGYGGAVALEASAARLERNVFLGNEARLGGAISLRLDPAGGAASLLNDSFSSNAAETGGALYALASEARLEGCVLAHSSAGEGLFSTSGGLRLACCDVWGNAGGDGWTGVDEGGNRQQDPLYCDPLGDLRLQADSPLWALPCGPAGAFEDDCAGTAADPAPTRPLRPGLGLSLEPNPANPAAVVRLRLPRSGTVELRLHDLRGALRGRGSATLPAGEQRLPLAAAGLDLAGLPGGLYFLHVRQGGDAATVRLLLLP